MSAKRFSASRSSEVVVVVRFGIAVEEDADVTEFVVIRKRRLKKRTLYILIFFLCFSVLLLVGFFLFDFKISIDRQTVRNVLSFLFHFFACKVSCVCERLISSKKGVSQPLSRSLQKIVVFFFPRPLERIPELFP